jgi:hypothetical protein
MTGLYNGVEEIPFKKTDSGYVFKCNNPWLIGPRRYYDVNEAQKTEITACLRETLRRLKPFVFAMIIVIPLSLVGGVFWLVTNSGTLTVIEVDSAQNSVVTTQFVDPFTGSTGSVTGSDGSRTVFHINRLPGKGATISYTNHVAEGETAAPIIADFASGSSQLKLWDAQGRIFKIAAFDAKTGGAVGPVTLYSILLMALLFMPYLGFMHVYAMRRLRPLIADLPRSSERIRFREETETFATKISLKLLIVLAGGCGLGFVMNAIHLAEMSLRQPENTPSAIMIFTTLISALTTAYCAYIVALRLKMKRSAS